MIDRTRESRTPPARRIPSTTTYIMYAIHIYIVRVRLCAVCLGQTQLRWYYIQTHVCALPIRFTDGKKNNNTMKLWSVRERQTCLSWNMFSIYYILGTRVFWISHIRPAKRKHSNRVYCVYEYSTTIITMLQYFYIRIISYYTNIRRSYEARIM